MNIDFNSAYDKYIAYLSLKLKPTTLLNIKRALNKHVLTKIGNMCIYNYTCDDYFSWQNYIKNLGFSNSFNSNIQIIFTNFFDYLESFFSVENIPKKYGKFKSYNVNENKQNKDVWTIKDFRKFIKHVDDITYNALFTLLFFTGLRKGEALALRFKDIDNKYISINKTITKEVFNNKHLEMTPKSKKSIRKIRIDRKLKNKLNKLCKYYIKKYNNFNSNFYVFGANKPISCTTLKRKKDYYCDIAHVKRIRIHDFRHSHATLLYQKNIKVKVIQERLGHASIDTTLNTYVHLNTEDEKKVLKVLNFLNLHL